MTETTAKPGCQICLFNDRGVQDDGGIVYTDDQWVVRTISKAPAVAGWLIMQTRRHIGEPADMNAAEAASYGPTLQRLEHILKEVTGALRIYTGSLNEGSPHFHTHMLPRLAAMPNNALGWNAFALSALASKGEVVADPDEVSRVLDAVRERALVA